MEESSDPYSKDVVNGDPGVQHTHQSLRRKIKYYFMNPYDKFYARGRKPWKLSVQLVKIVIITIQLVFFGLSHQMVVTFKEENLQSFKHLFLKDYADGNMDTYAVYRQADTYDHIDYIIEQYRLLHNTTVGNHEYEKNGTRYTSLELCQAYYRNGTIYSGNETFEIDAEVENDCYDIYPGNNGLPHFELHFKKMLSVNIKFVLKAINLQTVRHKELPDCYDFTVLITFDNQAHSGQIKIDLDTDVKIKACRNWKVIGASARNMTVIFDCIIIITCITSFSLCLRSVLTGIRLQRILILTLRAAFPNVIRFICCAGIIYISYCFCGWIVLGPYHEKFRTLNTVSECLFSLVNGDDMFPTFKDMRQKRRVWLFSRVYFYSFVSLFIYIVLSLFITIITDTYDTVKQQQNGALTSDLQKFLSECNDLPNSGAYRLEEKTNCFLDCCEHPRLCGGWPSPRSPAACATAPAPAPVCSLTDPGL